MKPSTSSDPTTTATASTPPSFASFHEPRHPSPSAAAAASAIASTTSSAAEDLPAPSRDNGQDTVVVERRSDHSALCRWTVSGFPRVKARALWSRYFEVGGFDCRLLIYPKGDAQALPGYLSLYLQVMDPRGSSSSSGSSSRWDCFASYRLSIVNHFEESKSVHRDSWHRFSSKKKSHGWCDFTPAASLLDNRSGFLLHQGDSILVTADILILDEWVSFSRGDGNGGGEAQLPAAVTPTTDVLSGKFTWKVKNFSLFRDMIKSQKIMSPVFPAGECSLRISVYQSMVGGIEHLSMCLESKDTEKNSLPSERSCWCLFRMSVLSQRPASSSSTNHVHRDSYGRFATDNKGGDNTSLGWNDYMRMSDFLEPDSGYLVDDTAVFSVSFHVIKESSGFSKNAGVMVGGRGSFGVGGQRKSDGHFGKFTWRIENFTKLKDLLKKRKITGLCVKSKRFQIGNRDCRLIVYPRGQSQPPCHLSVFLEVTDSRNASNDWSCFVSHRLSVVNQKQEERCVSKESQNRYSKSAKDWGWREFVTLTSLFDQDSGFLVQDTVVFAAEVLILKETSLIQEFVDQAPDSSTSGSGSQIEAIAKRGSFTWRVENFLSFKEIMETRKIFSNFFQAGGCELRIGVYESFDTICIYLESDPSAGSDPEKNFWVRYRMAVVNQKNPAKTVWKETSICTKTWNNSVLQFMKVSDMLENDAGFLLRDTVVFVCEILDCCPWFEFSDLEVLASDDDQDALSTDPDELNDSDDSEGISGDEEDMFHNLLSRAGFHLTFGDNPSQPQVTLREKLLIDAGAIAGFLSGLRIYLDDPAKVKRLLLPTKLSSNLGKKDATKGDINSPSLMNLLMSVKVLQQAIIDLLLDIMVECCQPSDGRTGYTLSDPNSEQYSTGNGAITSETSRIAEKLENKQFSHNRLDVGTYESCSSDAVQSSEPSTYGSTEKVDSLLASPPETSAVGQCTDDLVQTSKTKWPEQSEELLGLIVNSLRALDSVVPQGCPEPRRRPQSVQKIALLLDKAPKHLQPDLISLVPKLIDQSEHTLAACTLLDCLQKPDAESALRLPVFGALRQLEFSSDVWERVLFQAFDLLSDSNDEALVEAMNLIFKAASQSQLFSQAAKAVRSRLKSLGMNIPRCVLDAFSDIVKTHPEVAKAILKEIDLDCEVDKICISIPSVSFAYNTNGFSSEEDQTLHGGHHISDIYVLVEMLSVPGLFVEASQVFERSISHGAISLQLLTIILDRRHSNKLCNRPRSAADDLQDEESVPFKSGTLSVLQDDFSVALALGDILSLSRNSQVQDFIRMLYAIMFKIYADEHYRIKMVKGLVDRVTSSSENSRLGDIDLDVLAFLVREEDGVARLVLNMMREAAELAHVDRASLWHQLCAMQEENTHVREEWEAESFAFSREKTVLTQRLSESEKSVNQLKLDLRSEADRFTREKKELLEHIVDVENQLDWVRSEKDDVIAKLSADKKALQDHLHEAEMQLSQLKSRKRDELKKVVKEKNALAERLKNAEAARRRFDEELRRYASETVTREEVRQSLEDEVRRLTETVGQTEGEKREKEQQVARCEAYIDGMEARLQTCQQYIQSLEALLKEEMSRHAPLYGVGLDTLSMMELETLARIHEEGLRQIHVVQQRIGATSNSAGSGLSFPPHSHSMFAAAPPMAVGLPSELIQNHGNGHMNGTTGPWFSLTK